MRRVSHDGGWKGGVVSQALLIAHHYLPGLTERVDDFNPPFAAFLPSFPSFDQWPIILVASEEACCVRFQLAEQLR